MRRYPTEQNHRWVGFEHRPGDIVISTRAKCGTTWLQMILAVLVFGDAELPAPLAHVSPWLDWDVEPLEEVRARLDAQEHRRIVKTHTPLDGLPLDDRVTYVVVGRRPLDVAVSLYHHARNLDRVRLAELTGKAAEPSPEEPLADWAWGWLDDDWADSGRLETLSGLVHHVEDAWARRDDVDIVLVHFDALIGDLDGQMHRLAERLKIVVSPRAWPDLVEAASFESMKARAEVTVPDHLGVLVDQAAFFRHGRTGEGVDVLSAAHVEHYRHRLAALASDDVATWLDRGPAVG